MLSTCSILSMACLYQDSSRGLMKMDHLGGVWNNGWMIACVSVYVCGCVCEFLV